MRQAFPKIITARLGLFTLCALLSACASPAYYLQAVSGQWKLMHSRQPVQALLDDPNTPADLVGQLHLADNILSYADDTLGLPANGSYKSYVKVENKALVWNVIATPEFSLQPHQWCFPVAGCVPYRGYFKREKALKMSAALRARGMDVVVSPAAAYSSLGWFNDPLLSTMFSGSQASLAAYLFHELAHQRVYLKGDGDFNESYAGFVEETGLTMWLGSTKNVAALEHWRQLQTVKNDFTELLSGVRSELATLYASGLSVADMRHEKTAILQKLVQTYAQLRQEKWHGKNYFSSWFEQGINNASLALYNTYDGHRCAFKNLLNQADGDIRAFHRLVEQKSRLKKAARQNWLNQSCGPIAPTHDM